ncbi:MAG: urease accessory protein [Nitrospirae bacterium]|nr:MAG: urease accessory protein [Nitrospirota bacterium]
MDTTILMALILGLTMGMSHAFDPDHLVAMSTFAAESESVRDASWLGFWWGAGHTLALGLVGGTVLILDLAIPPSWAVGMEGLVGIMIIVLGGRLLWRVVRRPVIVHHHVHRHGQHIHRHFHLHGHEVPVHHHGEGTCMQALLVGIVHGMAGSAALSVMVMASMPTVWLGLVYMIVFGIGSIGGMLAMSALMSLPFAFQHRLFSTWHRSLRMSTALVAIGFGCYLTWAALG